MSGLESRLQAVDGVAGIELELGESGLEGITVRLSDGADEVAVLEGVRRLLVAYGTKTPRESSIADEVSEVQAGVNDGNGGVGADPGTVDRDVADPAPVAPVSDSEPSRRAGDPLGVSVASAVTAADHRIWLAVEPGADRSTALVSISIDDRSARRQVPASPRAIVQSVIDAGAELSGREPISVIGINVSNIDATRLLTVIVGNHGSSPRVCTASVVESDWPEALLDILCQVLDAARVG
ncbi:hypothetical protein BH23ACT5_BH23ACT5_11580 [soil metagenome]